MDPMKPASSEPNRIEMPSLKENLDHDIGVLDRYFEKAGGLGDEAPLAAVCWSTVREAAISFAELFDRIKDKEGGGSSQ